MDWYYLKTSFKPDMIQIIGLSSVYGHFKYMKSWFIYVFSFLQNTEKPEGS